MYQPGILSRRQMLRSMHPTWKKIVGGLQPPRPDPGFEALACLLRYLELYWPLRLLLRDCCPGSNMTARADILHWQPRRVARPQPAVDRKVENCQFTNVRSHLKPRPNCPDLSELQRRLLPGKFALVPRHTMTGRWVLCFHDNLLSIEGRSNLRSFGRTLTDPKRTMQRVPSEWRLTEYSGQTLPRVDRQIIRRRERLSHRVSVPKAGAPICLTLK